MSAVRGRISVRREGRVPVGRHGQVLSGREGGEIGYGLCA